MINIVLYDAERQNRMLYTKVIRQLFYSCKDRYEIHEFDSCTYKVIDMIKNSEMKKIYILSTNVTGESGLKLARKIRANGDVSSPIILITDCYKQCKFKNIKNTLILNIIDKNNNLIQELSSSLHDAYKIMEKHIAYTFAIFDEVYRIPYNDIIYIEKNINDDTVTIHTFDDSFIDHISIRRLERKICDDPRFFKTHRSCIVNLLNVSSYNRKDNIVMFRNDEYTDLVSRSRKKLLSERLYFQFNLNGVDN